jgi:hypothetical protein
VGLGHTRDVSMIEGEVEVLEIDALPQQRGDRFAARTGFDPRAPDTPYRWFRTSLNGSPGSLRCNGLHWSAPIRGVLTLRARGIPLLQRHINRTVTQDPAPPHAVIVRQNLAKSREAVA